MKPPRCGRVDLAQPGTLVLLAMLLQLLMTLGKQVVVVAAGAVAAEQPNESNLKFDPHSSSYQGLTFTFDPRLDKQVEQRLHFDHWQQIMQQSSSLLYDSLQGRAHLSEVQVLIPFKWRRQKHHQPGSGGANELRSVLYKPGAPITTNRRLRFSDSDVIVGFEDPVYKETPFSMQHDECGRPGLNIRMPISFLDHQPAGPKANSAAHLQALDSRLKARQFVREFASHRYGLFKESGFRSDLMYPAFSSIAGLGPLDLLDGPAPHLARRRHLASGSEQQNHLSDQYATTGQPWNGTTTEHEQQQQQQLGDSQQQQQLTNLRGFDEHFRECKIETSPASGLPANAQAANCLAYLIRPPNSSTSFNLMSADPFSYTSQLPAADNSNSGQQQQQQQPVSWLELAEQTKWHFCGENFANPNYAPLDQQQQQVSPDQRASKQAATVHFEHNQRAANKQNKMCHERSALEVIKSSDDFRNHPQLSTGADFYRLPASSRPNFKFLQEMPPRLILAVEYTAHLFQSRRLDHAILESAINKFLALDLIAESELATVVFGQRQSRLLDTSGFQRLDSSLSSRFTLFNPALDPFDEQLVYYNSSELEQVVAANSAQSSSGGSDKSASAPSLKILKGSCSFARMMLEVNALLARSSQQEDDLGADLVVLTGGLFVEDEAKIEKILKASNFKLDQHRLNMILYPSSMLFDTKTREGLIVLDSQDSEQLIRQRIGKLLTIQRLTRGRLHLVREQLDSTGDVRMSTLMQFYQIFDQLAKGHSWDQTNSLAMIASQQVDSRLQVESQVATSAGGGQQQQQPQYKLSFQFQLDATVQNELIVGFIDPKVQQPTATAAAHHHLLSNAGGQQQAAAAASSSRATGKRFSLKNLQLRSPGGHFVFTETSTLWSNQSYPLEYFGQPANEVETIPDPQQANRYSESAFFPYRAQLSLAAFHVKPWHLANLQAQRRLAGTWTLIATSDEPIQTSGLALARVNPQGDTLTGSCWIQRYYQQTDSSSSSSSSSTPEQSGRLEMVKVFVQAHGAGGERPQELSARMEVQDEMGNIVQNVQMLDDGLGAPDMTSNDGILTQYVQRAARSGFYKVTVELATDSGGGRQRVPPTLDTQSGQDNVCCGSFIPTSPVVQVTGRSTRQLYCGTFHVDAQNRLNQQRPPRTSNLTVVNVDQDNRRVTIRWFEPQLDISSSQRLGFAPNAPPTQRSSSLSSSQLVAIASDSDLQPEEAVAEGRAGPGRRHAQLDSDDPDQLSQADDLQQQQQDTNQLLGSNQQVLIASGGQKRPGTGSGLLLSDQMLASDLQAARYDIKLFTDRDIIKRTFDSKQEVGFRFNEWTVEGQFPNASQFGGMKEVTLRVPFAREGFYYIAMKTYNNIGLASQMSNIVQFYLRNNLTSAELESIYLAPGTTMDAAGNIYDAQGVLVQRATAGANGQLTSGYSLLRGTGALDGLSMLILFSVLAFMMTILCCTLLACLISSARHSLKAANKQRAAAEAASDSHLGLGNTGKKSGGISSIVLPGTGTGTGTGEGPGGGSGSSMVSSSGGCESSEAGVCSASSSLAGSEQQVVGLASQHQLMRQTGSGHEHENKLLFEELTSYNKLRQVHRSQQQQAHLIQQQLISTSGQSLQSQQHQQQQQEFYSQPNQQQYYGPQHTIVNGYTYATVMQAQQAPAQYQTQSSHYGDLGQQQMLDIPTSSALGNPVQSWPADILLSHYDKVKQARERNEAPPVMRIETLEHNTNGLQYSDGLPVVFEQHDQLDSGIGGGGGGGSGASSNQQQQQLAYSSRPQPPVPGNGTQAASNYLNQQLQQQLSSVLAGKRQSQNQEYDIDIRGSSPALEGVTASSELGGSNSTSQQDDQQHVGMPPPPQYIYCTPPGGAPIDTNGLGSQLSDPTIYSQSTNLQQVVSSNSGNFYANQWSPNSSAGLNQYVQANSNIYSTAALANHQQQRQHGDSAISEV